MNDRLIVFEGYDGSGKSSLIREVRDNYRELPIRIVGRKSEPELQVISAAIEDEKGCIPHDAEILLRFALEAARHEIIRAALLANRVVMLDRGAPSLISWIDYYALPQPRYDALIAECVKHSQGALLIACVADFDTCWSRVAAKPSLSKKERLGREANRRFYDQYMTNLARLACEYDVVEVDTASQSLAAGVAQVGRELAKRGLP